MHMANELLSVSVAAGTCGAAAVGLGLVCRRAKKILPTDNLALMGILGAFVFAAQMVQFPLPFMPGVSGHLIGAVLLAIILGPCAGAITISSVIIIQCLIFQDGGLLALGCNIINMGLVPSFAGYYLYKLIINTNPSQLRIYVGTIIACVISLGIGAVLVPVEAVLSGILKVPFITFLKTMVGVHLVIGIIEGLITAALLVYLKQVRPEIIADCAPSPARLSRNAVCITLIIAAFIVAGGLSLFASELPDGLEWSYSERPNQPEFESVISNQSPVIASVDNFHARYSPLPDYTIPSNPTSTGWTSFIAVAGAAFTMATIWLTAALIRKRNGNQNAPCTS